jgi:hypothetical protein
MESPDLRYVSDLSCGRTERSKGPTLTPAATTHSQRSFLGNLATNDAINLAMFLTKRSVYGRYAYKLGNARS